MSQNFDLIAFVTIGDKKYKLQHPGNREWLKKQSDLINVSTGKFDMTSLLDYCFEHVVFPEKHQFYPTLDTIHPKHMEEWTLALSRFLRGEFKNEHELPAEGIAAHNGRRKDLESSGADNSGSSAIREKDTREGKGENKE